MSDTEPRRYLVTSGLPYSNGRLHVGHIAGAYLPADTWVRYRRARGDEVRFVCGSDDNGVASLISARKEGRTVQELTADYHARQVEGFRIMDIEFDVYGGTHQPDYVDAHERMCRRLFSAIHDNGWFVKRTTEQLYDVEAKQFLPDRFVQGTCYNCGYAEAYGDQCESCGIAIDPMRLKEPKSTITGSRPEPRETVHWYIQLQRMEEPLKRWLEARRHPAPGDARWRDTVLNFSLGQIKNGLPERAMTRDLDWGVPVPLDDPDAEGKVLYVWFDAPIGYVSFTDVLCRRLGEGDDAWEGWWKDPDCRIVHFIGEDNTVFHALIWPAMLMAEGSFQLPWNVVANAFLNIRFPGKDEEKVSKSRGTAIWIEDYGERFPPDPLRYYLTAIAPENARTTFDIEDFAARNNGELVNALGNFVHRSLVFCERYFAGKVPEAGRLEAVDREHLVEIDERAQAATEALEAFRFKAALGEVMALARAANGYLDRKAPWKQRKTDLAACGTTVHVCLRTVKALAVLLGPFLPGTARRILAMLELPESELVWDRVSAGIEAGRPIGTPEILFKKIEPEELTGIS